jgi:hypothetical protein
MSCIKEHGHAFSPELKAWTKPYLEKGWKFTALKVSKKRSMRKGGGRSLGETTRFKKLFFGQQGAGPPPPGPLG